MEHLWTTKVQDLEEDADDLVDIKIDVTETTMENFGRFGIPDLGKPLSGLIRGGGCSAAEGWG